MPQLGDIKKGKEIGSARIWSKFMWCACQICGKERWVELIKGKPVDWRCRKCAMNDPQVRLKQRISHLREGSAWWKGGIMHDMDGYVRIYTGQDNPFYSMISKTNLNIAGCGYIAEHRLVMAQHLGRCLKPYEVVHHKNGIKDNNRIENLYLTTIREHQGITAFENRLRAAEAKVIELQLENILLHKELDAYSKLKEALESKGGDAEQI